MSACRSFEYLTLSASVAGASGVGAAGPLWLARNRQS